MAKPISTIEELQAIDGYADGSSYYLTNDIDASDTINWNAGAGFKSLLGADFPYGQDITFDGMGYKIKNLYINRPGNRVGLFYGPHGTVENLILENVQIHGGNYSSGIAATLSSGHTILNCSVSGVVTTSGDNCGGLCAWNIGGTISKCSSKVNISNTEWGIHYGSFVGKNEGTITDCYATGNVTSNFSTHLDHGGFAGRNNGTINRCYSTGEVTPKDAWYMGGFVGYNSLGTILSSYWDTETSGYTRGTQPDTDPPSGKTTSEMMQQATFVDWDFDTIWTINEGVSYPTLQWEPPVVEPPITEPTKSYGSIIVLGALSLAALILLSKKK